MGTPGAGEIAITQEVMADIPDGQAQCGGVTQPLSVMFDVPATPASMTNVAAVAVDIDFKHGYLRELAIELRHEPSGRRAFLLEYPGSERIQVDGVYTFSDDAPPYPADIMNEPLPPGAYAAKDSLVTEFQGVAITGTWILTISDSCGKDAGFLREARLRLHASCP